MNSEADKAWARLYPYEHSVLELDEHHDYDTAMIKYQAFVMGYNTAKANFAPGAPVNWDRGYL